MQRGILSQADLWEKLKKAIYALNEEKVRLLLAQGANPKALIHGSGKGSGGKEISKQYNMGKAGQEIILACYQKILDNVIAKPISGTKRKSNGSVSNESLINAAQTLKAVLAKQQTIDQLIPYSEIILRENDVSLVYNNMQELGIFPSIEDLKISQALKTSAVPKIPKKLLASLTIQPASTVNTTVTPPVVTVQNTLTNTASSNVLSDLPKEMLGEIMDYLPMSDMVNLARTSKFFALKTIERYYPKHFKKFKKAEAIVNQGSMQLNWELIASKLFCSKLNGLSEGENETFEKLINGDVELADHENFTYFVEKLSANKNANQIFLRLYQFPRSQILLNKYYEKSNKNFTSNVTLRMNGDSQFTAIGSPILRSAIIANQSLHEIKQCMDAYAYDLDGLTKALCDAISFDRKEAAKFLLQHKKSKDLLVSPNHYEYVINIFVAAARNGSLSLFMLIEDELKLLISTSPDVASRELTQFLRDMQDKDNNTISLLSDAALSGNQKLVKYLVETHKMEVDIVNAQGVSLLEKVLNNNKNFSHIGTIMYLLEKSNNPLYKTGYLPLSKKDLPFFFRWLNHYNIYFAHRAVARNKKDLLMSLVNNGFPVNVLDDKNNTLLHAAAAGNHIVLMNYLITQGISIESVNTNGDTPLHLAAKHGANEAIALLLEKGANKRAVNATGKTPLYMAAFRGNAKQIEDLWFDEAKNQLDGSGQSVLYAAIKGYMEACKTNGSRYSVTPYLSLCVKVGDASVSMSVIDTLIAKGVNVNACSVVDYEKLPLSLAAVSKDTTLVKKLLDAGATVPDMLSHHRKNTPLSMITGYQSNPGVHSQGSQDIMKLLLIKLLDDYIKSSKEVQQEVYAPKPVELQKKKQKVKKNKVDEVGQEGQHLEQCLKIANTLRWVLDGVAPGNDFYKIYNNILRRPHLFQTAISCMNDYDLMIAPQSNRLANTSTITSTNTTNPATTLIPEYPGTMTFCVDGRTTVCPPQPSVVTSTSTLFAQPFVLTGTAASSGVVSPQPISGLEPASSRHFASAGRTGGLSPLGAKRRAKSDPYATESDNEKDMDDKNDMDDRKGPIHK